MYASASQERQEEGEEGRAGGMGEGKLWRCHPPETYGGTHVWSRTKEGWRAGLTERRRGFGREDERPEHETGDQSSRESRGAGLTGGLIQGKYAMWWQQSLLDSDGSEATVFGKMLSFVYIFSPTILKRKETLNRLYWLAISKNIAAEIGFKHTKHLNLSLKQAHNKFR